MSKVLAVLGALAVLAVCVAAVGGSVERYTLVTGMRVDGGTATRTQSGQLVYLIDTQTGQAWTSVAFWDSMPPSALSTRGWTPFEAPRREDQ